MERFNEIPMEIFRLVCPVLSIVAIIAFPTGLDRKIEFKMGGFSAKCYMYIFRMFKMSNMLYEI